MPEGFDFLGGEQALFCQHTAELRECGRGPDAVRIGGQEGHPVFHISTPISFAGLATLVVIAGPTQPPRGGVMGEIGNLTIRLEPDHKALADDLRAAIDERAREIVREELASVMSQIAANTAGLLEILRRAERRGSLAIVEKDQPNG